MLAEDPSAFGLIYILKFSYNFSYFIGQVSKNTSSNCGNTTRRCLGVYIGCSWSILCGFVFLLFGMATTSGTIPYILPAYLGNSFTCVQYRMCYTCLGPVFWCEFNHDINLVIGLTKFGNLGNWYTCICIQHQFSMWIQPQWWKCNPVPQYMGWACRDCHGYGKTCGFEVMGLAGTGTVVNFDTLQHTAYPCHGITGINGYISTEYE